MKIVNLAVIGAALAVVGRVGMALVSVLPLGLLVGAAPSGAVAQVAGEASSCAVLSPENERCPEWIASYDHPGGYGGAGPAEPSDAGDDRANKVAVSPDGQTVFVTGSSWDDDSSYDYATVAHDAVTGAQRWAARYDGPASEHDVPFDLAVSPAGDRVFVTGIGDTTGTSEDGDYHTVAYDTATGEQKWVAAHSGGKNTWDQAHALGVSPDGKNVYVTGIVDSPDARTGDYGTVAYDAVTGEQSWVAIFDGRGNSLDSASALAVSSGAVVVTGMTKAAEVNQGSDYATIAYNITSPKEPEDPALGEQLWVTYSSSSGIGAERPFAIELSSDANTVYVAGMVGLGNGGVMNSAAIAYDAATGKELWVALSGGNDEGFNFSFALAVDPVGQRVYVTGLSQDEDLEGKFDMTTIAYDASTGAEVWRERFTPPGRIDAMGTALAVSPDGSRLYVGGFTSLQPDKELVLFTPDGGSVVPLTGIAGDYATLAYEAATGDLVWESRYNTAPAGVDPDTNASPVGFEPNFARDLALAPDGDRLFVTGRFGYQTGSNHIETLPGRNHSDFGTLAYATNR